MKLLFCNKCGDIFNLALGRIKSCHCGQCIGWYTTTCHAEVNGKGVSMAMGTGSIHRAILLQATIKTDWRDNLNGADPFTFKHPTSIIAWARPHDGPANSHTKIVPDLDKVLALANTRRSKK